MIQEIFLKNLAFVILYVLGDYLFLFLGLTILFTLLYIIIGYLLTK